MAIRDELDAINAGMARALAEQDANRFASYYTEDARLMSHGQPIIRGRAEIEAEVRDWVAGGPVIVSFETGDVIADGSLVVDVGRIISPRVPVPLAFLVGDGKDAHAYARRLRTGERSKRQCRAET